MSWWDHFAEECPRLAELGFTQAWLPPPNKAMAKVIHFSTHSLVSNTCVKDGHGYDAYDLVRRPIPHHDIYSPVPFTSVGPGGI